MIREASRTFAVIELTIDAGSQTSKVELTNVDHDEHILDRHIIAIVGGRLHRDGGCDWCNSLMARCASRRIA